MAVCCKTCLSGCHQHVACFAGYNKGLPVISGVSVHDVNSASVNYSYIDASVNNRLSLFSPGSMLMALNC